MFGSDQGRRLFETRMVVWQAAFHAFRQALRMCLYRLERRQ
jgi:hypothetical protein